MHSVFIWTVHSSLLILGRELPGLSFKGAKVLQLFLHTQSTPALYILHAPHSIVMIRTPIARAFPRELVSGHQSSRHLAAEPGRTWRWVQVPRHQAGRIRFLLNLGFRPLQMLWGSWAGVQSRDTRDSIGTRVSPCLSKFVTLLWYLLPCHNHQADRCSFFRS